MSHILDPKRLIDHHDYRAALDELDALMREDPDTPVGCREDELTTLIERYEAERGRRANAAITTRRFFAATR